MHPKEAKLKLAQELVTQYHSTASAQEAVEAFEQVFSKKELPRDILEYKLKGSEDIIAILTKSGLVKSGNEARRLIKEKAIIFEEKKIEQVDFVPKKAGILKVGSRRFLKIIL